MKAGIRQYINRFRDSEIIRSVAMLSAGSVLSQIVPVVMSVILSRLYTPEDYGDFGVFINAAAILAVVVSLRYEYAIVRPRREVDAANLTALSCCIAIAFCLLLGLGFFVAEKLGIGTVGCYPYKSALLIYTLCIALLQILSNYANRLERYKALTLSTVTRSLSQAAFRLLFGLLHYGGGLIAGCTLGILSGSLVLLRRLPALRTIRRSLSWRQIARLAVTYRNFPCYLMPSGLLNALSHHLPVLLLANFYAREAIGYLSMAIGILYLPMTLIGNALGQVFYKKASVWEKERTNRLALRILSFNAVLGGLILALLFLGGEHLFILLLGARWEQVGRYAIYLTPWLIATLCLSPLSWIFDARDRQKTEMWINACMFVCRNALVLVGGLLHLPFLQTLWLYSLAGCLLWLFEGFFICRTLELRLGKGQRLAIAAYIGAVLLLWWLHLGE